MGAPRIKRSEYREIKKLVDSGLNVLMVSRMVGRGKITVKLIGESNSFANYRLIRNAYTKNYQPVRTQPEAPTGQSNSFKSKEFDLVKALREHGISWNKIAKTMGRSPALIYTTREYSDYDSWCAARTARNQALKAERQAKQIVPTTTSGLDIPPASEVQTEIVSINDIDGLMERNNQALVEISKSLRDLAREWNTFSIKLDEVLDTKRPWLSKFKG